MLKKWALKSELAGAALAVGLMGASPAFAQDNESPQFDSNTQISTEQTVGTSTEKSYTIDPYNPELPGGQYGEYALWLLALLAGAATLNAARTKMEGAWLRAGAMGVAVAVLANPETVVNEYEDLPTEVLIMIDKSQSQGLDGRDILTATSSEELQQSLAALGNVRTTIVEFGDELDEAGTNLSAAIQTGLNTIPSSQLGAVFILSDGQIHDAQSVLNIAGSNAPIHALISGDEDERDFYITIDRAPRYGMAGEAAELSYSIHGGLAGDVNEYGFTARLSVNGEDVTTAPITLNENGTFTLPELPAGQNNVEVSIVGAFDRDSGEAVSLDEITLDNNRIATTIEGIQDDLNVLLISGAPHQGTRHWRDMLSADPDINFMHFAYLRPPEKEDETPLRYLATTAFPVHEVLNEDIEDYDVIIFDNYTYNGIIPLSYFSNIKNWVENGGALLVAGGEDLSAANGLPQTSLGDILPLIPNGQTLNSEFTPQISEDGQRHPLGRGVEYSFSQEQSWGPWYSIAGASVAEGADVLMTDGNDHPLLALGEYGEGRVAMLSSDQTWLWARGHKGGGPAAELTRNLTRWLVQNPSMDDEDIRLSRQGDQMMIELQTMGDELEDVVITTPSGEQITVTPEEYSPGLRRAFINADQLGVYSVQRSGENADAAFAEVGLVDPIEMREVVSTFDYVLPLTKTSGGETARMSDIPQILKTANLNEENKGAMGVNITQEQQPSGTQRSPIIPQWLALMMSLGMFAYAMKREGGKPWRETVFGDKKKTASPSAPPQDLDI